MKPSGLFILAISLFVSLAGAGPAEAQVLGPEGQVSATNPEAERTQFMKTVYAINYEGYTDLSENARPRRYNHTFDFNPTFIYKKHWLLTGDISFSYFSIDKSVPTDRNLQFNDAMLALSRKYTFGQEDAYNIIVGGGDNLPLSERSQYEGIKSIPFARLSFLFNFPRYDLTLVNRTNYAYYVNRYLFSPVDKGYEPRMGTSDSLALIYSATERLSLTAFFGIKLTQYLDNYSAYNYKNGLATDYLIKDNIYVELGWENGTFTDNEKVDLWYLDKYRQIVSLSTGATF